ncbi:MAG: sugar phosphate isomerase/epimerase [Saprospiraceae bacterium]|nr:sugar phosphate isomerase/epimerase [Saprospiraceae bacterium]
MNCGSKSTEVKKNALKVSDIGVQLYTVRELMATDPVSTLKSIAEIGYTDVECAGYNEGKYYGMSPSEFKNILTDFGLKMQSGHVGTGILTPDLKRTMSNEWEGVCEDAKNVGQEAIFCGYFQPDERKTLDDYRRVAELFNKCSETAKSYGLIFGHHNHDFEFEPIEGQIPFTILLKETDPDKMVFELDMYWTTKAGVDPVELMKANPGRFPSWHIKDMAKDEEQFFTEVGNGSIDFKKIFEHSEAAGLKYFYVEQDECRDRTPLESIKMSFDYLKGW